MRRAMAGALAAAAVFSGGGAVALAQAAPASHATRIKLLRSFSGKGSKTIGTVTVHEQAILRWYLSSGRATLTFVAAGRGHKSLAPRSHTGEVVITADTYRNIHISTSGRWTLQILRS